MGDDKGITGRVGAERQGPADEQTMPLVWEKTNTISGLSQPSVRLQHPPENTAFGILISLHYLSSLSIHLLYNSLRVEVLVHLECL